MTTMGQRAAGLAERFGLAVFPIFTIEQDGSCSCGKTCSSPGKHPIGSLVPQGVLNASQDAQMIREWWALYPDANIGIATGDASGVVVLDIDEDHGGGQTLDSLEEKHERLPDTWCVLTGGGGAHVYFRMPGVDVRNSAGAIGPGLDVRGNGGYVVVPPSRHVSGDKYRWAEGLRPIDIELADVPSWLMERMGPRGAGQSNVQALPSIIGEGLRNVWMASAAGTMRRRGFSEDAIFAALSIENRKRCQPPLTDREVRAIARSIERYPPERMIRFGGRQTA